MHGVAAGVIACHGGGGARLTGQGGWGMGAALGKAMEWLGDADRKKSLWGSINHARGACATSPWSLSAACALGIG